MTAIETLLHQPAAQIVGWALIHFIWQGALIGGLAAIALAALRHGAADVRYVVSTIALSLMLTLPAVTAMQIWRAGAPAPLSSAIVAAAPSSSQQVAVTGDSTEPGAPLEPAASSSLARSITVEPWLPALVLAWMCGVGALTLRLISGWLWVQRIRSHGTAPPPERWLETAARLSRRLHIARRVRLLESTVVDVPTVIGWIKPVVLLPASALAGLAPHQLEAILAHELAHIRRHDYAVNLLQTLVETLLFYHPAVWWLSRRIRAERENCCDDLAVSLCGDPYSYAQALADLEELRGGAGRFALAANGGSLVQRVRRLLGAPTHAGRAPGWLAGSVTVLVMFGVAAGAVGSDAFQPEPTVAEAQSSTAVAAAGASEAQRPLEAAGPIAAAAEQMERRAQIAAQAATAAASLQQATGKMITPVIAAEPFAAKAAALHEAALSMAAQAEAARRAAAGDEASRAQAAAVAAAAVASAFPQIAVDGAPSDRRHSHARFSWSNNGEKLEVEYYGEVEFTDDDSDVKRLSPGGSLRIKDGGMLGGFLGGHTIDFSADASGTIRRHFWVGSSERPFEPEGRQWLAKALPRFIRQTGIGAPARVARIFKQKGAAGVLSEISLIEGSFAKRIYFTQLLKTAPLDPGTIRQVLAQAGREIDSDFELASLLIDSADTLLVDEGTRRAYFDAARTIESDFEMRRVYASALKRGPVSGPVLAGILDASRQIDSDFEQASLLIQIARLQPLDSATRTPFFTALSTVDSDFEHRRVLAALAERTDLAPETTSAMLASAASVGSDFEAASFLLQVATRQPIEGDIRAPFFRALDSVGSAFERGRVLQAVVHRPDASHETIVAAMRAAAAMNSSFEASRVLLAAAAAHPLEGAAREAYIDAAGKLGDFEQGQVLAALVRSERRK